MSRMLAANRTWFIVSSNRLTKRAPQRVTDNTTTGREIRAIRQSIRFNSLGQSWQVDSTKGGPRVTYKARPRFSTLLRLGKRDVADVGPKQRAIHDKN
ncbi:hypothetical protein H6P81_006004 [Aristolochia fimbriata]|uniref:Uncharacterized protein n=1 Tax=Aristolochia fimbriata TaxID=158543 RepID=A0AAV7EYA5_ARIFI|nr:hypothetical protein H6P81_006004 [Aristolochia fimbriata]